MGFRRKIMDKLTIIYIKASHCMERNKLNMYISTLEREIQDMKLQIGIVCYDRWKNDRLRVEDIEELLKIIDGKNEEIEKQKELILQLSEQEKRILGKAAPVVLPFAPIPSVSSISAAAEMKDIKEIKDTACRSDAEYVEPAGRPDNEQQPSVLEFQRYHR
ncbi:MAG: hypothetical protein HFI89_06540 [Lachnospiraceae bacterium]|nr:hypothetical protein [Lachnospiraceae bacterium]